MSDAARSWPPSAAHLIAVCSQIQNLEKFGFDLEFSLPKLLKESTA
jgi:hypothetical protein